MLPPVLEAVPLDAFETGVCSVGGAATRNIRGPGHRSSARHLGGVKRAFSLRSRGWGYGRPGQSVSCRALKNHQHLDRPARTGQPAPALDGVPAGHARWNAHANHLLTGRVGGEIREGRHTGEELSFGKAKSVGGQWGAAESARCRHIDSAAPRSWSTSDLFGRSQGQPRGEVPVSNS